MIRVEKRREKAAMELTTPKRLVGEKTTGA